MKSILDKSFVYVDAAHTDISKTFERIRREQKKQQKQQSNVKPIRSQNVQSHR